MFKVMNPELYLARTDENGGKLTFNQQWSSSPPNTQIPTHLELIPVLML
jgi:hypothetical protein